MDAADFPRGAAAHRGAFPTKGLLPRNHQSCIPWPSQSREFWRKSQEKLVFGFFHQAWAGSCPGEMGKRISRRLATGNRSNCPSFAGGPIDIAGGCHVYVGKNKK